MGRKTAQQGSGTCSSCDRPQQAHLVGTSWIPRIGTQNSWLLCLPSLPSPTSLLPDGWKPLCFEIDDVDYKGWSLWLGNKQHWVIFIFFYGTKCLGKLDTHPVCHARIVAVGCWLDFCHSCGWRAKGSGLLALWGLGRASLYLNYMSISAVIADSLVSFFAFSK